MSEEDSEERVGREGWVGQRSHTVLKAASVVITCWAPEPAYSQKPLPFFYVLYM